MSNYPDHHFSNPGPFQPLSMDKYYSQQQPIPQESDPHNLQSSSVQSYLDSTNPSLYFGHQTSLHPVSPQTTPRSGSPVSRNDLSVFIADGSRTDSLPELNSATTATSSTLSQSGDSEPWPSQTSQASSVASVSRSRKRRGKARIELAPDQPPTTQGTPRTRVFLACQQCRNRKIRCDGAQPVCHSCGLRQGEEKCVYDTAPKRRGPDKTPGARQRIAQYRKGLTEGDYAQVPPTRRRRRTIREKAAEQRQTPAEMATWIAAPGTAGPSKPTPSFPKSLPDPPSDSGRTLIWTGDQGFSSLYHQESHANNAISHLTSKTCNTSHTGYSEVISSVVPRANIVASKEEYDREQEFSSDITAEPSLEFTRAIWWDSLLSLYHSPMSRHLVGLTSSQRESAACSIFADIRFLFRISNYWLSFFHIPSFLKVYLDPGRRQTMQPSLLLALIAVSLFWQSSELGMGQQGREKAMRFRNEAQCAFEASCNAGWIDETLAQAAWLLTVFEVCAHPQRSTQRVRSSMKFLDSIICGLHLLQVDNEDPYLSRFSPRSVPAIEYAQRHEPFRINHPQRQSFDANGTRGLVDSGQILQQNFGQEATVGCNCLSLTLGSQEPSSVRFTPLWGSTPAWSSTNEGEIRKESIRRLCWSSIIVAAGHVSYSTVAFMPPVQLAISNPANFALLLTGESLARSSSEASYFNSSKETIWALYDRAYLLWHSCAQMRSDSRATDDERAHFGTHAWLEADSIERVLNSHTCDIEKFMLFQGREYLFNTRMLISHEFKRYIPLATADVCGLFHRGKAEEWLNRQAMVGRRITALMTVTGHPSNTLVRRPFFAFWLMSQTSRALILWQCDPTLVIALDACKAFLAPIDFLTALWPCQEQRSQYIRLREQLSRACQVAGQLPIPPMNLALPNVPPETAMQLPT